MKISNTQVCLVVLSVLMMLSVSGCFSAKPENIAAFVKPHETNVTATEYRFQPPDEISIHCSKVPEIDAQLQRIRPDGKISFEALGEIEVAGKTPEEVGRIVEQRVAGLYTLPGDEPIDVRIRAFQSKNYYVLGQVMMPGRKMYTGRDSVLAAVAEAGINPMAWEERIQVIRPSGIDDVPPKVFEVDFKLMQKHGDLRLNVLLQEGDIIYVPPTPFAAVALVIEEVMRPFARAFSGAYMFNSMAAMRNDEIRYTGQGLGGANY
jgi:polysaccharide biosynthesis/export protein